MKANTNNYKNKSQRQLDRSFGATQLLVLPTTSTPTATPQASATSEVNYSSNQRAVERVTASNPTSPTPAANPELEPASFDSSSPSRAALATPQPAAPTPLNPTVLLCQVASYQYALTEHGSQSSTAHRFFKPIYDAGYSYALWLATSKPTALRSTELPALLAQNTMTSVQRRLTIEAGSSASPNTSPSPRPNNPENLELEIITDVPGLITHCFYQEYASFLQSKLQPCQRQPSDNWSRARYCNHANCQSLAAANFDAEGSASSAGEKDKDNLAFSLDMFEFISRLLPVTPHKIKSIQAATPQRQAGLRLAIQTAFTRLSPCQCQAITDYVLGYSLPQIGNRRGWTARRASKHIYQAKRWLRSELMFSGLLPLPTSYPIAAGSLVTVAEIELGLATALARTGGIALETGPQSLLAS